MKIPEEIIKIITTKKLLLGLIAVVLVGVGIILLTKNAPSSQRAEESIIKKTESNSSIIPSFLKDKITTPDIFDIEKEKKIIVKTTEEMFIKFKQGKNIDDYFVHSEHSINFIKQCRDNHECIENYKERQMEWITIKDIKWYLANSKQIKKLEAIPSIFCNKDSVEKEYVKIDDRLKEMYPDSYDDYDDKKRQEEIKELKREIEKIKENPFDLCTIDCKTTFLDEENNFQEIIFGFEKNNEDMWKIGSWAMNDVRHIIPD